MEDEDMRNELVQIQEALIRVSCASEEMLKVSDLMVRVGQTLDSFEAFEGGLPAFAAFIETLEGSRLVLRDFEDRLVKSLTQKEEIYEAYAALDADGRTTH